MAYEKRYSGIGSTSGSKTLVDRFNRDHRNAGGAAALLCVLRIEDRNTESS
jgi:hypothetical protein